MNFDMINGILVHHQDDKYVVSYMDFINSDEKRNMTIINQFKLAAKRANLIGGRTHTCKCPIIGFEFSDISVTELTSYIRYYQTTFAEN